MPATPSPSAGRLNGLDQVRGVLLTALHLGKLRPGDRAPSVRSLADRTGMDKKTIHRAYTQLADEGLLRLRPGSGTFINEESTCIDAPLNELLGAALRCKAAARTLKIPPSVFGAFLDVYLGDGLRGVPLLVAECNYEQIGIIEEQLKADLGVVPRPVLLTELVSHTRRSASGFSGIVTTDCHLDEVSSIARDLDLPVYRIALDSTFPQQLASEIRRSRVVLVVKDRVFGPVLLRLLGHLAVPAADLERLHVVGPREVGALLGESAPATTVLVSPLVSASLEATVPSRFRCRRIAWCIEATSLDRLRVRLALDMALRRRDGTTTGADRSRQSDVTAAR